MMTLKDRSKRRTGSIAVSLSLALCGVVVAQDKSSGSAAASASTTANADMTEAEVRKVDKESGKITLKHGEIKNLDMPGMTMVFQMKEPGLLDKVQVGDKVKFKAEKVGGAFVVTEMQTSK